MRNFIILFVCSHRAAKTYNRQITGIKRQWVEAYYTYQLINAMSVMGAS